NLTSILVTTYAVPPRGRRPYTGAHFLFALQGASIIRPRADHSDRSYTQPFWSSDSVAVVPECSALEGNGRQSVWFLNYMDDETRLTHSRPDEGMISPMPTSGGQEMDWKKTLMYGSFAAGAILFLTGRRPAALAVAGIGVATFATEHPEKFAEIWH